MSLPQLLVKLKNLFSKPYFDLNIISRIILVKEKRIPASSGNLSKKGWNAYGLSDERSDA